MHRARQPNAAEWAPASPPASQSPPPAQTPAPVTQRPARDGLSLATLIVAALASATAAIITSTVWRGGTIITAAMTPVIVAIAKELFARPIESDLVRRPVERIRPALRGTTGANSLARPSSAPATETPGDRALGTTPFRTYGRPSRRRLHVRLAITTGMIAFAIAAAVLTVPELIFGGAVAGSGSTTLGGGSSSSARHSRPAAHPDSPSPATKPQATTPTQTAPAQSAPPAQQPQTTQPTQTQPPAQSSPAPRSQQQGGGQASPSSPPVTQPPVQGAPVPPAH